MGMIRNIGEQDCVSSLAAQTGFHPDTIWEDPANSSLRSRYDNARLLRKGDKLTIPEKQLRTEEAASGKMHRFVRKGIIEYLHVTVLDSRGNPRPGVKYELRIGHELIEGEADDQGDVRVPIRPWAKKATLFVEGREETDEQAEELDSEYEILIGALNPPDDDEGLLMRLENLGYEVGKNVSADRRRDELIRFQASQENLTTTGELDKETRSALKSFYEI